METLINLMAALIPPLAAVIIGLASWGLAIVRSKIKLEAGKTALDQIDRIIGTVVGDISQTAAEEMKRAAADGKLSTAEKQRLKDIAVNRTYDMISSEVLNAASKTVDDVGDYVNRRIEERVLAGKGGNA